MPNSYRRRACQSLRRMSQSTLIAYLPEGSKQRTMFENMDRNDWEILSFDPTRLEVCVVILNSNVDENALTDQGVLVTINIQNVGF